MGAIAWLLCVTAMVAAGDESMQSQMNDSRARLLADRMHEVFQTAGLDVPELEIRLRRDVILVTGTVEDAAHGRLVLEAIERDKSVKTIHLSLGVGQAPEPLRSTPVGFGPVVPMESDHWLRDFQRYPYTW